METNKLNNVDTRPDIVNDQVTKVVKGIARKYGSAYGMDAKDIEQELWLKLLEERAKSSSEKLPHMGVIATTGYNKAVDIYRKERRRWDSKTGIFNDDEVTQARLDTTHQRSTMMAINPFTDIVIHAELKDAIGTLKSGSRERKYIVMKGYVRGVFDIEEAIELEPSVDAQQLRSLQDSEHRLAKALNLCGANSGAYRTLKKNVKNVMKNYFGPAQ
ncbi:sigma-70 family RNA polymerase sigma factor [Listeria phage LIS04]|nr:sigma-70 family RNA polymerase sigma factor [Listeria phage LIS04]